MDGLHSIDDITFCTYYVKKCGGNRGEHLAIVMLLTARLVGGRVCWQVGLLSSSACYIVEVMPHRFGACFPSQLSSGKVASVKISPGALTGFPAQHILDAASKLEFADTTLDSSRGMMQPPKLGLDTREIPTDAYTDSCQCCSCQRLTPYSCDICDDAARKLRDALGVRTQWAALPPGNKKKYHSALEHAYGGAIDDEENSRLRQSP